MYISPHASWRSWKWWRRHEPAWLIFLLANFSERSVAAARFYMEKYVHPGLDISAVDDFTLDWRYGNSSEMQDGVYWDAPFGFILYYKNAPVAVIGFKVARSRIVITQLQGIAEGKSKAGLYKIRWEQFLVGYLIHFVRDHRRSARTSFAIMPARKLRWWCKWAHERISPFELRDLRRRLQRRYDGTAKELGFRFSGWSNQWVC